MTSIRFRCATDVVVEADWDETVLDALLRSGTDVPFFCRAGICGQCKSRLLEGEVTQVGSAPSLLTDEEARQGHILICRSIALSDCVVVPENLPRQSDAELPWPDVSEVTLATWVAPGLFHMRVEIARQSPASIHLFHAGQYTFLQNMEAGEVDLPSRLYPATRPGHRFLDFYLRAEQPGQAQLYERVLPVGQQLTLARPVGVSALKEGEKGPALLVAEQDGLPALLCMLEMLCMREDRSGLKVLIRGARAGFLEERITHLCEDHGIALDFVDLAQLETHLRAATDQVRASPANSAGRVQAYVKGSEPLVRVCRQTLYAHGLRPWEVHAEMLGAIIPV